MSNIISLKTPLSEDNVRGLRLNDVVHLTGHTYTMMYIDHFTRILRMIEAGEPLPMELRGSTIYNTGTIFQRRADGSCDLRAIGATTSSKFNGETPEFIRRTGIRAIIGKGGMDQATLDAMRECGCVYLAVVGGCSAIYTECVKIEQEYWPQHSWADNQLKLHLNNFGPLYVAMDAHGNSVYEQSTSTATDNLQRIYQSLDIV